MIEECTETRTLDFAERYCRSYRDNEDLEEFLALIDPQPDDEALYTGENTWGNHGFTPSNPFDTTFYERDDGIRTCHYAKKGELIFVRNTEIQFIVDRVEAIRTILLNPAVVAIDNPMLSEIIMLGAKAWFWKINFKRIRV